MNKIYPHVRKSTDVSWKDILMVMDCDHMLKPDYFQKCCAVMLDKDTAVRGLLPSCRPHCPPSVAPAGSGHVWRAVGQRTCCAQCERWLS